MSPVPKQRLRELAEHGLIEDAIDKFLEVLSQWRIRRTVHGGTLETRTYWRLERIDESARRQD